MLNRCAKDCDSGLTWEADPRHVELAVAELSPGGASTGKLRRRQAECATGPRGTGARRAESLPQRVSKTAYLAADRPHIAFACKECSRAVRKATRGDLTRLKRIGRYLLHTPRAVWEFPLQNEECIVTIGGPSTMKIKDEPPDGNVSSLGAERFRCACVFPTKYHWQRSQRSPRHFFPH